MACRRPQGTSRQRFPAKAGTARPNQPIPRSNTRRSALCSSPRTTAMLATTDKAWRTS
jgi:hypothetical protein